MSPWSSEAVAGWKAIRGVLAPAAGFADRHWSRSLLWVGEANVRLVSRDGQVRAAEALDPAADASSLPETLSRMLPKPRAWGVHRVELVLGWGWAHHFVLPWRPEPTPAQWVSAARIGLIRSGLGAPETWRFAVEDASWGKARLVAAVPDAVCTAITRVCRSRRYWLSCIHTGFTHALRSHARAIREGDVAIVLVERVTAQRTIACIGFRRNGGWSGCTSLPVNGSLREVLLDAASLCGLAWPAQIYVICDAEARAHLEDAEGTQWLPMPWTRGSS